MLSGSSRKKSPTVGSKKIVAPKKIPRKKATVITPLGSGGNAANPGDANVLGHSSGQGKPLGMVDGSNFSDVDTVPGNPENVSLGGKGLSSVTLLSTHSESLVKRHTNPAPVIRSPVDDWDRGLLLSESGSDPEFGSGIGLRPVRFPIFGRGLLSDPSALPYFGLRSPVRRFSGSRFRGGSRFPLLPLAVQIRSCSFRLPGLAFGARRL